VIEDALRVRAPGPNEQASRPVVRTDELFRGEREIIIVHLKKEYRLRITRAGKLILTK